MKKRHTIALLFLVCTFAFIISACNNNNQENTSSSVETQATTESTTVATTSPTEATTTMSAFETSSMTFSEKLNFDENIEDNVASASLNLPKIIGDSSAIMNINSYYSNILENQTVYFKEEFYTMAKDNYTFKKENESEFLPFNMRSDFWISCNDDKYLSVVRSHEEFTGGSSSASSIACETFSKSTGAVLQLPELFKVSEELYMKKLLNIIKTQAKNKPDLFENYEELLQTNFDKRNFYLTHSDTEKALVIVYQPYQIAPGSVGTIDFCIDFEQLKDIMK